MAGVTFTRSTPTYDEDGGGVAPVDSTITGNAMKVRPRSQADLLRYQALGLVESEAPTLLFAPTTYGQTPQPGDKVTWNNLEYTVRDVNTLAPDGITIIARVVIQR